MEEVVVERRGSDTVREVRRGEGDRKERRKGEMECKK